MDKREPIQLEVFDGNERPFPVLEVFSCKAYGYAAPQFFTAGDAFYSRFVEKSPYLNYLDFFETGEEKNKSSDALLRNTQYVDRCDIKKGVCVKSKEDLENLFEPFLDHLRVEIESKKVGLEMLQIGGLLPLFFVPSLRGCLQISLRLNQGRGAFGNVSQRIVQGERGQLRRVGEERRGLAHGLREEMPVISRK